MLSYCVKCHKKTAEANPHQVTTANGRHAIKSVCPVCGTTKFRFVSGAAKPRGKKGGSFHLSGAGHKKHRRARGGDLRSNLQNAVFQTQMENVADSNQRQLADLNRQIAQAQAAKNFRDSMRSGMSALRALQG